MPNDDEIDALLFRARMPAIAMLRTPHPTDEGTPGCWFGGEPTLPPEIEWPIYEYRNEELGIALDIPMHFLVQINLDYLPRVLGRPQLPRTGTLFAFFDPAFAAAEEGIDLKLGKGCRLIYSATPTLAFARRHPPPMPDLSAYEKRAYKSHTGGRTSPMSSRYNFTSGYTEWPFGFIVFETFPNTQTFREELGTPERLEIMRLRQKHLTGIINDSFETLSRSRAKLRHWIFGVSQRADSVSIYRDHLDRKLDLRHLTDDLIPIIHLAEDEEIGIINNSGEFGFYMSPDDIECNQFSKAVMIEDF